MLLLLLLLLLLSCRRAQPSSVLGLHVRVRVRACVIEACVRCDFYGVYVRVRACVRMVDEAVRVCVYVRVRA